MVLFVCLFHSQVSHAQSAVAGALSEADRRKAHAIVQQSPEIVELTNQQVISLDGHREAHALTRLSSVEDTYHCEGHVAHVAIETRTEYRDADEFKTFDISVRIDGQPRKFVNTSGVNIQDFYVISSDASCIDRSLTISIYGHNDSTATDDTRLARFITTW